MPAISGLDLLTLMRTQGYRAPFIFITAFPDESVRARALKAGAICFLAKPFAAPHLIECLGTALKGHRGGPTRETVSAGAAIAHVACDASFYSSSVPGVSSPLLNQGMGAPNQYDIPINL